MKSSNSFPDLRSAPFFGDLLRFALLAFLLFASPVFLSAQPRRISQYALTSWDSASGFPGGQVHAFAQTPDGFLWIGSEKGLVQFDGIQFHTYSRSKDVPIPKGPVLGLVVDGEGSLWIRWQGSALYRFRDGRFQEFNIALDREESALVAMCRGAGGRLLVAGLSNGILEFHDGRFERLAFTGNIANFLVLAMAETPDHDIWLGTRDLGLFSLTPQRMFSGRVSLPNRKINVLVPAPNSHVWVGTDSGLFFGGAAGFDQNAVPAPLDHAQIFDIVPDASHQLWISTSEGLFRFDPDRRTADEAFSHRGPNAVTALFRDREGNLWVGDTRGIQQVRETPFATFGVSEGMPSDANGPIFVDSASRLWFAPLAGGLFWMENGAVHELKLPGADRDIVYSLSGGGDDLWVGLQRGGLLRVRFRDGVPSTEEFTRAKSGLAQDSVYAVHRSSDGSVWAGTLSGGISLFHNGKFTNFAFGNGPASNTFNAVEESSEGFVWFATPTGLEVFNPGHWRHFSTAQGLPSNSVNCLHFDSRQTLWIGTALGLAYMKNGRIRTVADVSDALREPVFGLAEDKEGSLWIATSGHVLQAPLDLLASDDLQSSDLRSFGISDGLRGVEGVKRSVSVVADPGGRIWFSLNRGISVVDPAALRVGRPPTLVHLEGVSADGLQLGAAGGLRVPSNRHRLNFQFVGLNLAVPGRIRYKFKLDPFDSDWSQPVSAREATYTNLPAGRYVFRVIASNAEGDWNSQEASVAFRVLPVFWKTWWFVLAMILLVGLLVLIFFQLRMRSFAQQLNVRFEERLQERTRIAQELHDTLLQGVLSASMQLHVANDQLTEESPAKPLLTRVLSLMNQVVDEGRAAVRGLRTYPEVTDDLEQAFLRVQREFALPGQSGFRVLVEGDPRPLLPAIRDELYLIGRESLVNAFRHSDASHIEVEIEYAPPFLRLIVRDDGRGIDPHILAAGREGHWGLSGMRERAERIGARLRVMSAPSLGTEIELFVPGAVAFAGGPARSPRAWYSRLFPTRRLPRPPSGPQPS